MQTKLPSQLRIGICGSASVGKTSLVNSLSADLGLPRVREEMRDFLESTGSDLTAMPAKEVAAILLQLWSDRNRKEQDSPAFIADNCPLDFIAYALYYGCLTKDNAGLFLSKALDCTAHYDAIVVLPWGVLPYTEDGVRPASQYLQLRYQLILEGLLRRYVDPQKLHFLPEGITHLDDRRRWIRSLLMPTNESPTQHSLKKQAAKRGFVYLVGAGPGDPGLLTVRAAELLQKADVVAHDLLVSPDILAQIPATVEQLPVGRRYGTTSNRHRLHPEVLARAKAGQIVVRLKCGDPLLFGRGGEEAEELVDAGIPFEIIPGVSAAFGAAAYSGIPLTHRGIATEVLFSTGHEAAGTLKTVHSIADQRTTVLYMAARRLQANIDRLIQDGYTLNTPAALVASATTGHQQVMSGTLATLPEIVHSIDPEIPALLIAGRVVGLSSKLSWFDKGPLQGSRILVARARPGASVIANNLRELGASIIEAPSVSAASLDHDSVMHAALARLQQFDAVVFSCADGVRFTIDRFGTMRNLQMIAIGNQAIEVINEVGIIPVLAITGHCHDAVGQHAAFFAGKRLLLITSNKGRPGLSKELSSLAASVESVAAYQVVHEFGQLVHEANAVDLVLLPSSSAASLLLQHESGVALRHIPMIAMGPETEAMARQCGARDVLCAPHDDVESIVSCTLQRFASMSTMTGVIPKEEYVGLSSRVR